MGNYFDKEREIGLATRDFNKKTAIFEAEYKNAVEKLLDDTMFDETPICESAAWFMFKHSPVVSTLLEYDYLNKLYARSAKYYEKMSLTEELVFGEDTGKTVRIQNIHNAIDTVESIKEAFMCDDVQTIVEGVSDLIPLYCLFEEEAREKIEGRLADAKKEQEEEEEKAAKKAEKETEKEAEEAPEEDNVDDESSDEKESDEDKEEEDIPDDENKDDEESLKEEYLEEAKKRKPRPDTVVKKANRLRIYAARLARDGDAAGAVEANNAAKELETNADEILAKEKRK